MLDNGRALEVVRVAVLDGATNACSMLYSACARAGVAMGYRREAIFTYVLESETGHSLKAAGWVRVSSSDGGTWDRPSRQRTDSHPLEPKVRWHAAYPTHDDFAAAHAHDDTASTLHHTKDTTR